MVGKKEVERLVDEKESVVPEPHAVSSVIMLPTAAHASAGISVEDTVSTAREWCSTRSELLAKRDAHKPKGMLP